MAACAADERPIPESDAGARADGGADGRPASDAMWLCLADVCDDGLVCNGLETCVGGECLRGTAISCDDGDACTHDGCLEPSGTCGSAPIDPDRDFDGDVDAPCGPDCDASDSAVHPGAFEQCYDAVDNDCDAAVDCADDDCVSSCAAGTCPNDDLGYLVPVRAFGTTVGAGDDSAASCGGGDAEDVAFWFFAEVPGEYVISTAGSSFDTVLYILGGGCGGPELACNDDEAPGTGYSRLTVRLGLGTIIVVVVDGARSEAGNFELWISGPG